MKDTKTIVRFNLPEEVALYIQELHYRMDGLRVLAAQLIDIGITDHEVIDEYQKAYAEWRLAFDEVINEVAPQYANVGRYKAEINYSIGQLRVYEEV